MAKRIAKSSKRQAVRAPAGSAKKRTPPVSPLIEGVRSLAESRPAVVRSISTGCLAVDALTGVWGLPRGRFTEIFGPESSGKTTLLLSAIRQAQEAGGKAAFIDAENGLECSYPESLGVDIQKLDYVSPDSGEQSFEILEKMIQSGKYSIIGVDSVAALVPTSEIEGDWDKEPIGRQAQLMSRGLRRLNEPMSKCESAVVFLNQVRNKIGIYGGQTTPGGRALRFYASVRLEARVIGVLRGEGKGAQAVGKRVLVKCQKNKVGPPLREAETNMFFSCGFDSCIEAVELGARLGVVELRGSWYSYKGKRLGQGQAAAAACLRESATLRADVLAAVSAALKSDAPLVYTGAKSQG